VAIDPLNPSRWVTGGVGAFFDNGQIVVLTSGGSVFTKTWEKSGAGVVQDIRFDPNNPSKLVAGLFPSDFGVASILRSSTAGNSWIEVPGTAGWSTRAVAFDPHTSGRVLQLSWNNRWASSANSGQTWTTLQPPWAGGGEAMLLDFDPFTPGVVYRGETGTGLWRSTDGGSTWTSSFTPVEGVNNVSVRQTDVAGNVSASSSVSFTLDSTVAAPTVSLTTDSGASNSDGITKTGTLTVGGTESGATVQYSTDGGTTRTSSRTQDRRVGKECITQS
jgi:hypothetical protein